MGGKEGGRGYLYQGIVAVLEALRRNDWDRIYIEFPTEGDKVDIAEGIVGTLECIAECYPKKPFLPDRGVPEHDVFEMLSDEDYDTFYKAVCGGARLA